MKGAVIQLCSKIDAEANLSKIHQLLESLSIEKLEELEALFLPECFYSLSDGINPSPYLVHFDNQHYIKICELAKKYKIALLGGSVAYEGDNGEILNRSLNIDCNGELISYYDKIHLFQCALEKVQINEGNIYSKGNKYSTFEFASWKIASSICFDLRYSSMYHHYRKEGAELMLIPSAFTPTSGKAHWHTLVRARAIENQCFVIAAGQTGKNNERVATYGHSLVVDPWGEVLVDAGIEEGIYPFELDKSKVDKIRKKILMSFASFE